MNKYVRNLHVFSSLDEDTYLVSESVDRPYSQTIHDFHTKSRGLFMVHSEF